MARPKLHPYTLAVIARSHCAGTPCAELARAYGITRGDVTNITRKWQTDQLRKASDEKAKQARLVIVPPPMETPEPGMMVPVIYQGRPIIRVRKTVYNPRNCKDQEFLISLPYVAMQGARS